MRQAEAFTERITYVLITLSWRKTSTLWFMSKSAKGDNKVSESLNFIVSL